MKNAYEVNRGVGAGVKLAYLKWEKDVFVFYFISTSMKALHNDELERKKTSIF